MRNRSTEYNSRLKSTQKNNMLQLELQNTEEQIRIQYNLLEEVQKSLQKEKERALQDKDIVLQRAMEEAKARVQSTMNEYESLKREYLNKSNATLSLYLKFQAILLQHLRETILSEKRKHQKEEKARVFLEKKKLESKEEQIRNLRIERDKLVVSS